MIHRFKYLKYALVLVFIGSKVFLVGMSLWLLKGCTDQAGSFFCPHLGTNIFALCDVQQFGNLADQAVFMGVQMGVGIGDLPQVFNQLDFLRMCKAVVDYRLGK